MTAQLMNHRIAAGFGNAGVDHFDHHIRLCHGFGGFSARLCHVPREPLDGHVNSLR